MVWWRCRPAQDGAGLGKTRPTVGTPCDAVVRPHGPLWSERPSHRPPECTAPRGKGGTGPQGGHGAVTHLGCNASAVSGSFPTFDPVVAPLLARMQPRRALDLGAGSGKYGRLLREAAPDCERVAVELDAQLAQQHDLASLYHQVHVADAATWCRQQPACFDVVVVGDCLNQLPKSEGLDLLNALVYRCAWLLVLNAEFVVQPGAVAAQRSVWSERDLHWHDLWAWDNERTTTLALLRGYQASPLNMDQLVRQTNEANWPLLDFDGQTTVRPCRLRLVDHAREVAYRVR